jgi:hypothetical protein
MKTHLIALVNNKGAVGNRGSRPACRDARGAGRAKKKTAARKERHE